MSKTTKQAYEARIQELLAAGRSRKYAEHVARTERRLASPQHKAAVARKLSHADARYDATGDVSAFNAVKP